MAARAVFGQHDVLETFAQSYSLDLQGYVTIAFGLFSGSERARLCIAAGP